MMQYKKKQGMVLLIALLIISVTVAVGATLLNVTLKQFQLAGISRESEIAFHAANSGMECAYYYDKHDTDEGVTYSPMDTFALGNNNISIECMGTTDIIDSDLLENGFSTQSGDEQQFEFTWNVGNELCTKLSVYKFYEPDDGNPATDNSVPLEVQFGPLTKDVRPGMPCPEGVTCTVLVTRGYNAACSDLTHRGTVERELTIVY